MKNIFLLLAVTLSVVEGSFSQTDTTKAIPDSIKAWKKGGVGALNFSQVSFSNWAAGGENAISAAALLNFFANYKKDKTKIGRAHV